MRERRWKPDGGGQQERGMVMGVGRGGRSAEEGLEGLETGGGAALLKGTVEDYERDAGSPTPCHP